MNKSKKIMACLILAFAFVVTMPAVSNSPLTNTYADCGCNPGDGPNDNKGNKPKEGDKDKKEPSPLELLLDKIRDLLS